MLGDAPLALYRWGCKLAKRENAVGNLGII